jgi:hypothetical protein
MNHGTSTSLENKDVVKGEKINLAKKLFAPARFPLPGKNKI